MKTERRIQIACAKEACKVCGKAVDGPLYIGKRFTAKAHNEKTEMEKAIHGQVVGWKDEPCAQCQEDMKMGIVVVIIDESKSDMSRPPWEGWRTGKMAVMKQEAVERMFGHNEPFLKQTLKMRAMFLDTTIAVATGIEQGIDEAPKRP